MQVRTTGGGPATRRRGEGGLKVSGVRYQIVNPYAGDVPAIVAGLKERAATTRRHVNNERGHLSRLQRRRARGEAVPAEVWETHARRLERAVDRLALELAALAELGKVNQ